ncbi:MAG: hypothetical protein IH987_19905 [Planctomycetes bacterium]|nr:hypothetical protein [Planctomycetota bacterium]
MRSQKRAQCAVLVCWMTLLPMAAGGAPRDDSSVGIEPDPVLQARFLEIAGALDKSAMTARVEELRAFVDGDLDRWIPQLLYYLAYSQGTTAAPAAGFLLQRLSGPKDVMVAVVARHLGDPDAAIRHAVRDLLHHYEDRSAGRTPDFSAYRALIESEVRAGRSASISLVRFMYESDPSAALLTLIRGYQLRQPTDLRSILWAEHIVDEMLWKRTHGFIGPREVEPPALRELETLSRDKRWWVRAYVAQILHQHSELRRQAVVERLARDHHPLVREILFSDSFRDLPEGVTER